MLSSANWSQNILEKNKNSMAIYCSVWFVFEIDSILLQGTDYSLSRFRHLFRQNPGYCLTAVCGHFAPSALSFSHLTWSKITSADVTLSLNDQGTNQIYDDAFLVTPTPFLWTLQSEVNSSNTRVRHWVFINQYITNVAINLDNRHCILGQGVHK